MIKGIFDSQHYQKKVLAKMQVREKEGWLLACLKEVVPLDAKIKQQARSVCLWLSRAYFGTDEVDDDCPQDFTKALKRFSTVTTELQSMISASERQAHLVDMLLTRRSKKRYKFSYKYRCLQAMLYQLLAIQLTDELPSPVSRCSNAIRQLFAQANWQQRQHTELLNAPLQRLFSLYQDLLEVLQESTSDSSSEPVFIGDKLSDCMDLFDLLKEAFEKHGFLITLSFDELLNVKHFRGPEARVRASNQQAIDKLFATLND